MKKVRFLTASIITAAAGAAGLSCAATAWADGEDPAVQPLGQQGEIADGGGVQGWTVTGLQPSADAIAYQPGGVLWEATATDQAITDDAIPFIPAFSARAANGDDYRALWQVPTALGVNPSGLAQGQSTTGKLYFDVTAAVPDSVVFSDGGQDQLIWVQPPPSAEGSPSGYNGATAWPATGGQSSGMPQSGSAAATATPGQAAGQSGPATAAAAADDVHGAATAAQPTPTTAALDVHDTTAPATSPAQVPSAQGTTTAPAASAPAAAVTPAPAAAPAAPMTKAPAPAS